MDYPKCPAIGTDLPCLQHAPEKPLIAAACVLVAAEGHDHSQGVFPQSSQGVFPTMSQEVFSENSQGVLPEISQGVFSKISQGVFPETSPGIGTLPGSLKTLSEGFGNWRKQLQTLLEGEVFGNPLCRGMCTMCNPWQV